MGTQYVFECFNCLGEGCPHCDGKGTMSRAQLDDWRNFIVGRVENAERKVAFATYNAKRAEAEAAALRAQLTMATNAVIALRAELDASGWRPVTERPTGETYVEIRGVGYVTFGGSWISLEARQWRPLPAPDEEARP